MIKEESKEQREREKERKKERKRERILLLAYYLVQLKR